jgi:hypothetical protein
VIGFDSGHASYDRAAEQRKSPKRRENVKRLGLKGGRGSSLTRSTPARSKMSMRQHHIPRLSGIKVRRRPSAIKLAVQMTEQPRRRRRSDQHSVDLPTVALAGVIVMLLIAACVVRLMSH